MTAELSRECGSLYSKLGNWSTRLIVRHEHRSSYATIVAIAESVLLPNFNCLRSDPADFRFFSGNWRRRRFWMPHDNGSNWHIVCRKVQRRFSLGRSEPGLREAESMQPARRVFTRPRPKPDICRVSVYKETTDLAQTCGPSLLTGTRPSERRILRRAGSAGVAEIFQYQTARLSCGSNSVADKTLEPQVAFRPSALAR
jgi:hypothetical protein